MREFLIRMREFEAGKLVHSVDLDARARFQDHVVFPHPLEVRLIQGVPESLELRGESALPDSCGSQRIARSWSVPAPRPIGIDCKLSRTAALPARPPAPPGVVVKNGGPD